MKHVKVVLASVMGLAGSLAATGCMDQVVARAGSDQAVDAGATVTLDGSSSTPRDAGRLAYLWEVVDGPLVNFADQAAASTTFTAPAAKTESTLIVRLTATYVDLSGQEYSPNSDTDEVLIRVRADRNAEADVAQDAEAPADNANDNAGSDSGGNDNTSNDGTDANANAADDNSNVNDNTGTAGDSTTGGINDNAGDAGTNG